MFKFLRRFQKQILVVGVAVLMVAFLIQPTLSMFGPNPGKVAVGTIDGREVTVNERRSARVELMMIAAVTPALGRIAGTDGLEWLLMLQEADTIGLSASESQVNELLLYLGDGQTKVQNAAREMGVPTQRVREALRRWIIVQQYRELVHGLGHVTLDQRLTHYAAAGQFFQMGYGQGAIGELLAAQGKPRISEPLKKRFLYDQYAKANIVATQVTEYAAGVADDDNRDPSEQELTDLFDAYKDSLPGQGEPYGLGYRRSQRVKIEYLVIPLNLVTRSVQVEEADALQYYDDNASQFAQETPADTDQSSTAKAEAKPYDQVRDEIFEQLRRQAADAKASQMIKSARATLLEDARSLNESRGYRVIPDQWDSMPLEEVAQRVHDQFGVRPEVHTDGDRWLGQRGVALLPGIGTSTVTGSKPTAFVRYVFSAKELRPADAEHELATLRLQAKMPSLPLATFDGARYLFRLTAAEAATAPASLNEVRDKVVRDARRVSRYAQLKDQANTWAARAKETSIEDLAREVSSPVLRPPAFPKSEPSPTAGMSVPTIEGIGQVEEVVEAVFDLANHVQDAGGVNALTPQERTTVVAVDRDLSLYLIRLDGFQPMTESEYNTLASSPGVGIWVHQFVLGSEVQSPTAIEVLAERVGFEFAEVEEEDPAEADSSPENEAEATPVS